MEQVLILDDDREWAELLGEHVLRTGFEVAYAMTGDEALEILHLRRANGIVAAVIDVLLPGVNGYQVAERIRADSTIKTIPFVFMTAAKADELGIVGPMALGAFDVLDKSAGADAIAGAVRIAINATKAVEGKL